MKQQQQQWVVHKIKISGFTSRLSNALPFLCFFRVPLASLFLVSSSSSIFMGQVFPYSGILVHPGPRPLPLTHTHTHAPKISTTQFVGYCFLYFPTTRNSTQQSILLFIRSKKDVKTNLKYSFPFATSRKRNKFNCYLNFYISINVIIYSNN